MLCFTILLVIGNDNMLGRRFSFQPPPNYDASWWLIRRLLFICLHISFTVIFPARFSVSINSLPAQSHFHYYYIFSFRQRIIEFQCRHFKSMLCSNFIFDDLISLRFMVRAYFYLLLLRWWHYFRAPLEWVASFTPATYAYHARYAFISVSRHGRTPPALSSAIDIFNTQQSTVWSGRYHQ